MPSRPSEADHVASVTGGQQFETKESYLQRMAGKSPNPSDVKRAAFSEASGPAPTSAPPTSTAGQNGRGEQLKMFMTPREIHAQYQPLDADRQESWEGGTYQGTYQEKSWDTGDTRPRADAGSWSTTEERRNRGVHTGPGGNDSGTIERTRGGGKYRLYDRNQGGQQESDDELWDRKLEEAQEFGRHGQHGEYGGGARADPLRAAHETSSSSSSSSSSGGSYGSRGNESLYDSIAEKGVMGPIRLGQERGSMGKPQVVGGHHRLAAATDIDRDRLVPVLHDESIYDAQGGGRRHSSTGIGYPYS